MTINVPLTRNSRSWKSAEKGKVGDLENDEQRRNLNSCDSCELYGGQIKESTVRGKQRIAKQEEADACWETRDGPTFGWKLDSRLMRCS
jgi:hypothetical protein